jgi:hypothetical protein
MQNPIMQNIMVEASKEGPEGMKKVFLGSGVADMPEGMHNIDYQRLLTCTCLFIYENIYLYSIF